MKHLLFIVSFLLAGTAVLAQSPAFDSIPFELGKDNRIYVLCRVNDSDTLRFLFDTGATDMVVNSNSPRARFTMHFDGQASNTGATGSNQVKRSSKNIFKIGRQILRDVPFIAIPYPPDCWDGVIGLRFIRHQVTCVDYQHMKIYLYDAAAYSVPEDYVPFKVKYVLGVPVVSVGLAVNGMKFDTFLEVDTGSDRIIDLNSSFVDRHHLLGTQKPFAISRVTSSDGGEGILENVYFEEVHIGKYRFPRIPGAFSTVKSGVQSNAEMDGVMGNNFLKRFNIICHLQKGYIYLSPNDQLYSPFYDFLLK